MHAGVGPKDGKVFYRHVPTQTAKGSDQRIRPDLTIMADMGVVHDEIVVTKPRTSAANGCTDMNGHVLTNDRALPDLEPSGLTRERTILGLPTQAGMRENPRSRPDASLSDQSCMGAHFNTRPEFDLSPHKNKGTHNDALGEDRTIFNESRRVDLGQTISLSG